MVFILTDPPNLKLRMMHKDYIVSLINNLKEENEDYNEKLLEDLTIFGDPEVDEPVTKRTRSQIVPPALERMAHSTGVEGDLPKNVNTLSKRGYAQAVDYNLKDMNQVTRLNEYLASTAFLELFQTPKNGQCFWASIRRGLNCKEEYRSNHLRYQTMEFVARNHGFCFTVLKSIIAQEYGNEEVVADPDEPGPFSFVEYLLYMLEPTSWGDHGMILMVSMMWQLPITVLNAEGLEQLKFRHNRDLMDTELVLVYAGRAHYLGTCKSFVFILPFFCGAGLVFFVWVCRFLCGAGGSCAGPIIWFRSTRILGSLGDHFLQLCGSVAGHAGPLAFMRSWCTFVQSRCFPS